MRRAPFICIPSPFERLRQVLSHRVKREDSLASLIYLLPVQMSKSAERKREDLDDNSSDQYADDDLQRQPVTTSTVALMPGSFRIARSQCQSHNGAYSIPTTEYSVALTACSPPNETNRAAPLLLFVRKMPYCDTNVLSASRPEIVGRGTKSLRSGVNERAAMCSSNHTHTAPIADRA
jgi:hypothetical protein